MPADRTAYVRVNWANKRSALGATNLNAMDQGIAINNALAKENANYIDEIALALIDQLSVTYDQGTHTFTLSIGTASGANPTTRFNVTKNVAIHTVDVELDALSAGLANGTVIPARATGDADGNGIKASYAASMNLVTEFDSQDGSFVLTLLSKSGGTLATKTFSIPQATTEVAGLLSAADKTKINAIVSDIATALAAAKSYTDGKVARANLVTVLGEASQSLNGLMSATDKARLDALHALLGTTADSDTVVNTINEVLAVFAQYPEGVTLTNALASKCSIADIVDALTSDDATKPLSAKQGKVLKGLIDDLEDGTTPAGKANCDALGRNIAETYFNKEDGFALGMVEAEAVDSVPETLHFDANGDVTDEFSGEITLRYNSSSVISIASSDVPETLTLDPTQDFGNMITNANWTGEVTFTY